MSAPMKFIIARDDLVRMYFDQKRSMYQIAGYYGCTHGIIVERFRRYGIKSRGHLGLTEPINITREQLVHWYENEQLSAVQIANRMGRSKGGIERRLRRECISLRGNEHRKHWKYVKIPFSGDLEEKAYMIGFRLGDLNVYQRKQVIVVRGSTTKRNQAELINQLFERYGGVHTTLANRGTIEQYAYLDNSFEFLLPKSDSVPLWINQCARCYLAFFAGYFDAEGCISFHKSPSGPFAGYEIQTQDKTILSTSRLALLKLGIISPEVVVSKIAGYIDRRGVKNNRDIWRLAVFQKQSVWKLTHYLHEFMKHKDKFVLLNNVLKNVMTRNVCRRGYRVIDLTIPLLPEHQHK